MTFLVLGFHLFVHLVIHACVAIATYVQQQPLWLSCYVRIHQTAHPSLPGPFNDYTWVLVDTCTSLRKQPQLVVEYTCAKVNNIL